MSRSDFSVIDVENPFGAPALHIESCTSTMEIARSYGCSAVERSTTRGLTGTVIRTDYQTEGRGRHRGRRWISGPGDGLLATIILHRASPAWEPIALRAALAAARVIEEVAGLPVEIKWPNDLLVFGRKTGGILIERPGCALTLVGIGLNVREPDERGRYSPQAEAAHPYTEIPRTCLAEASVRWADLHNETTPPIPDMDTLTAAYLERLYHSLRDPSWYSSVTLRLAYRKLPVTVFGPDGTASTDGIFAGISGQGYARIREADGTVREIVSGVIRAAGGVREPDAQSKAGRARSRDSSMQGSNRNGSSGI